MQWGFFNNYVLTSALTAIRNSTRFKPVREGQSIHRPYKLSLSMEWFEDEDFWRDSILTSAVRNE